VSRIVCVLGVFALLAAPALAAVITQKATTPSYQLTLSVGPKEEMYTAAEAKAKHPADGEVMLGGSMGGMDMSMGEGNRHLEVAIVSRATHKRLAVKPTITLTDTKAMSGMAMSDKVDAVGMYGVDEGMADLHYGNNVKLTAGHTYKVLVTVKGEKASFTFKA
jgi:hypothetical protein